MCSQGAVSQAVQKDSSKGKMVMYLVGPSPCDWQICICIIVNKDAMMHFSALLLRQNLLKSSKTEIMG